MDWFVVGRYTGLEQISNAVSNILLDNTKTLI